MTDLTLKLDAITLRAVAEYAASQRGDEGDPGFMITTFDPHTGWSTIFSKDPISPIESAVVTPVNTRTVTRRPRVEKITITAEGVETDLIEYDSVFWSESAVEKFVIPYYASKGQWLAAYILEALSRAFYGRVPLPNRFATGDGAGAEAVQEEPVPFALAHLPRSDYVGLDEARHLVNDLYVLLISNGQVDQIPLSDYLPEP